MLNMTLAEYGDDVGRNAYENVMYIDMCNWCIEGWFRQRQKWADLCKQYVYLTPHIDVDQIIPDNLSI